MTEEKIMDGTLIELGGIPSLILQTLEDSFGWTSAADLAVAVDKSEAYVGKVVKLINQMSRSVYIDDRRESGIMEYSVEYHDLTGARIPFGGTFDEKDTVEVEKIVKEIVTETIKVEVPVIKPMPIEVGSALKPKISVSKPQRKSKKTDSDDGVYKWAGEPKVPDKDDSYIVPPWFDMLENMVGYGKNVALIGPPGIGKSSAVEVLANKYSKPLVNIGGSGGFHPRLITGSQEIKDGKSWFRVAQYATGCTKGWWCKLDELNTADSDMLAILLGQLAPPYQIDIHGKSHDVDVENFRSFATMNVGLAGTKQVSDALLDRFFVIEVGYPDDDTLRAMLYARGCATEEFADSLITVARKLWDDRVNNRIRYDLSPRRLFDTVLLVNSGMELRQALTYSILTHVVFPPEKEIVGRSLDTLVTKMMDTPKVKVEGG